MTIYSVLYWSVDDIAVLASFKDYESACLYIEDIYTKNPEDFEYVEEDFSCIANDAWFSKYSYSIEENELKD